jgi:hypothetical protein
LDRSNKQLIISNTDNIIDSYTSKIMGLSRMTAEILTLKGKY